MTGRVCVCDLRGADRRCVLGQRAQHLREHLRGHALARARPARPARRAGARTRLERPGQSRRPETLAVLDKSVGTEVQADVVVCGSQWLTCGERLPPALNLLRRVRCVAIVFGVLQFASTELEMRERAQAGAAVEGADGAAVPRRRDSLPGSRLLYALLSRSVSGTRSKSHRASAKSVPFEATKSVLEVEAWPWSSSSDSRDHRTAWGDDGAQTRQTIG
eukprot:2918696-Rhodomonas_salina.3